MYFKISVSRLNVGKNNTDYFVDDKMANPMTHPPRLDSERKHMSFYTYFIPINADAKFVGETMSSSSLFPFSSLYVSNINSPYSQSIFHIHTYTLWVSSYSMRIINGII